MTTIKISVSELSPNAGQIEGLPKNPRFIKDERFEKLVKSVKELPEMLELRELIVFPLKKKYVVICGNMRLRAGIKAGYTEMPCKVLSKDTPPEILREIAIKDNISFGNDDFDSLANEWDSIELENWGMEIPGVPGDIEEDTLTDQIDKFIIEVNCKDENHRQQTYNQLIASGYECNSIS